MGRAIMPVPTVVPIPSNTIEVSNNVAEHEPNIALSAITVDTTTPNHHHSSSIGFDANTLHDGAHHNGNKDIERLKPMECKDNLRYNRKFNLVRKRENVIRKYFPEALKQCYNDVDLPPGWKKYTHPEGNVYFYHNEDKILTQNWIYDTEVAQLLDNEFRPLLSRLWKDLRVQEGDYHVVVDIINDVKPANEKSFAHYVADHKNLTIFWLNVDNFKIDLNQFGLYSLSDQQKQRHLECMYWKHIGFFPHVHKPSDANWDLLFRALRNIQTDLETSICSTSFLDTTKVKSWTKVAKLAKHDDDDESAFTLGRFMHAIQNQQFFHYHGEKYARLSRSDSIFTEGYNSDGSPNYQDTSAFFKIITPFLFYAPVLHLKNLNETWVDKITVKDAWVRIVEKLDEEWASYNILATVFLNANIAFLAIPAVDDAWRHGEYRRPNSWTHALSFLSTFAILCCIVLSLLLQRQHRNKKHDNVSIIHQYLLNMHSERTGFEGLAILYSMPYASLLWSVAFFAGAILTMCFEEAIPASNIVMGISLFASVCIITWSVEKLWQEDTWSALLFQWIRRVADDIGEKLWPCVSVEDSKTPSEAKEKEPLAQTVSNSTQKGMSMISSFFGRPRAKQADLEEGVSTHPIQHSNEN